MSGIYIHIPFCKQACHYCDFHFSTSLKHSDELVEALIKEISLQQNYLGNSQIETIYFGGGTPSVLPNDAINRILAAIDKHFNVVTEAEITLEANPDDLDAPKLAELRLSAINRLSIGVQSFFEDDLLWMNRSHGATQAESAIKRAQDSGLENINADLIYGFPLLSDEKWQSNIQKMIALSVSHLSCYAMTVEPKTALDHFIKKGQQNPMNESQSASQFLQLIEKLTEADYQHYEISNFALEGKESKHNTNYWKGISYLGIGPSAHSFHQNRRQWNVANNVIYLSEITKNKIPATVEMLSANDRFNEYLMTSLRTRWGANLEHIASVFGETYRNHTEERLKDLESSNWLQHQAEVITLTTEGKLFADRVASEFFIVDED